MGNRFRATTLVDLRDGASMIEVAANNYWKNSANPTPTRNIRRQLEKLIEDLREAREGLSELAPGYVEELSGIIDSLEKSVIANDRLL